MLCETSMGVRFNMWNDITTEFLFMTKIYKKDKKDFA